MKTHPDLDLESLTAFCRKWQIRELSLFGSALRDDFGPQSDFDPLVSFKQDSDCGLFDLIEMKEELASKLGRHVDLVEKEAIRNPWRRYEILRAREILYAA